MRETSVPKAPGSSETHAYDLQAIRDFIGLVPENCKVVVALAGYAGLSKSEIQGLVWDGYNGREIAVLSSVVNGKRGDTKTDARKDSIPLIEPVRKMLDMHRLKMGNPATGVMFPTKNGTPLSLHNLYWDYIQPVLERCALCNERKAQHENAIKEAKPEDRHEYQRDSSRPEWHGWQVVSAMAQLEAMVATETVQ
jgi:hypothetical protein